MLLVSDTTVIRLTGIVFTACCATFIWPWMVGYLTDMTDTYHVTWGAQHHLRWGNQVEMQHANGSIPAYLCAKSHTYTCIYKLINEFKKSPNRIPSASRRYTVCLSGLSHVPMWTLQALHDSKWRGGTHCKDRGLVCVCIYHICAYERGRWWWLPHSVTYVHTKHSRGTQEVWDSQSLQC